ncbi:MAG: choice-of-anchor X domain-containing protein [Sulfuricellaceae bacterium]
MNSTIRSTFTGKMTRLGLAVALALGAHAAVAAEHPLTKVNYDAAKNVNVVDLVMSIDWDFDNPPTGRDKSFIENILKQATQSYYTMTEGKQMLGKVYVYKNSQFMDNTDIQYTAKDGRANAHVAGVSNCKACRVQMFAGTNETPDAHGKTVAHEFGHYILGVSDEYREEGGTSTNPGSPQDGDTPKDSIMHNHLAFVNLSTASDYADPAAQKTAQYRTFGKSAWETLVSPPETDPNGGPGRTYFDPFKNFTAPTAATLTKPTSGWESVLQVVYMGSSTSTTADGGGAQNGPINIIVIDTTTSKKVLDAQLNAAQQVINAAGDNNRIAVYAYPYANMPVAPLTSLAQGNTRSNIKDAIAKIAQDAIDDDNTNGDRLFDWAETTLPGYFPSGAKSTNGLGYYYRLYSGTNKGLGVKDGRLAYYDGITVADVGPISQWLPQARQTLSATLQKGLDAIKSVRTDADTPMVTLFTTDTQTVDNDVAKSLQDAKVAVNPVVLTTAKGTVAGRNRFSSTTPNTMSLYDLAKGTKGLFQEAGKVADLSRNATKAANSAEGDNFESVTETMSDPLAAGAGADATALISSSDIDGEITFQAYWSDEDSGKISYALTAPSGAKITPTSLPSGITYASDAGEGTATYTVGKSYAGKTGAWTSTVTASKDTVDSLFQEVAVKSSLAAVVDIFGGSHDDKRSMTAVVEVSGPLPVKGASVVADIYSADDGRLVKSGLAFKDDGVAPDIKAGDGRYTASLADLPVGDYEIAAKISNDGTAVFTTANATKKGINQPDVVIPAFQRSAMDSFKKEL